MPCRSGKNAWRVPGGTPGPTRLSHFVLQCGCGLAGIGGHAPEPPLPAGVPGWGGTRLRQAPQWSPAFPRVGGAQGLAGPRRPHWPAFRTPLKAPGAHSHPRRASWRAAVREGRGVVWAPARAGPRRGRDPGAPHFHRPLPQSAPPWSSLLPGCAARLPGAPPHTHRGVCPSHGRLPSPLRVPSSLGHDGRRLTPRPCPSPGFGWALPGAWSLLTGSRLLPGLLLRETGHTRSPWGGALPGCRGLPTQLTRVRPVGALASPGVRGALLRDPLLKRPGGPLV